MNIVDDLQVLKESQSEIDQIISNETNDTIEV